MIPFNDLSRIHLPLLPQFESAFRKIVTASQFVLGEEVLNFETELAELEGSQFAVGINNGTNALELSLRAIGVQQGDEVITTAFTFVATVHAIQQAGAKCVLVDIFEDLPLLDFSKIEEKITERTKAIVLVSLHGIIDHLDEYRRIANKHQLFLILDGAQSHLARFGNKPLTEYFEMVSLSFYPGKNLGAFGEGGAVLTNNFEFADKLRVYRDWGAREKYNHEFWGGNYRLEPIQASMLRIKLPYLKNWTEQRKALGRKYSSHLPKSLLNSMISKDGDHVFHMYTIQSPQRERVQNAFNLENIGWGIHYPKAVHQNPNYSHLEGHHGEFRNAVKYASSTLSLPIFPEMQDVEQEEVTEILLRSLD